MDLRNNEFVLYEQLLVLENIAKQYPGTKQFAQKIRTIADEVASRRYKVAVIGEFKRGKSSLINALLGAGVLPTDVLPATGTVNRIVYGTEQNIHIYYKNGTEEERDISELCNYGTKLDEEKARTAHNVREIVVSYPSIFCKNHVELIDTPGLNDDETMTEATLGVLHSIDAAIVVISAKMPLSMTERDLIIKLIEHKEIKHVTFVITFIDAVSRRKEEQDRVIEYIKNRLTAETMELAKQRHGDDEAFLKKAEDILYEPCVFAVSSTQAMDGFVADDEELLEKSRFPEFKEDLLALLAAQQTRSIQYKTAEIVAEVKGRLDEWYKEAQAIYETDAERLEVLLKKCIAHREGLYGNVVSGLEETDKILEKIGISIKSGLDTGEINRECCREFIRKLAEVKMGDSVVDDTAMAISAAKSNATELIASFCEKIKKAVIEVLASSEEGFRNAEKQYFEELNAVIQMEWTDTAIKYPEFPEFKWCGSIFNDKSELKDSDVIKIIRNILNKSFEQYSDEVDKYIAAWRKNVFMMRNEYTKLYSKLGERIDKEQDAVQMRRMTLSENHKRNKQQIEEMV